MARPRGSGKSWRDRQESDPYVAKARAAGYRSRAVYKLEELLKGVTLPTKPRPLVIDLGAAPGAWSQYVARVTVGRAHVIAVDLLPMDPLPDVHFIQGDFTDDATLAEIVAAGDGRKAALVMSDMAPNMSGVRSVDQPRSMLLAELALDLCQEILDADGTFVCKVFQGEGFDDFVKLARQQFRRVSVKKPAASRDSSREVYLLARNYCLV